MSDDITAASPKSIAASNVTPAQTPSPVPISVVQPAPRLSSSRIITSAPTAAIITPKVAISTASSPTGSYAYPSPVGGGPTSTSYVVPPRPKPGRKPATDEPASKRKAQNRESQRAFRARKAAKLTEMQAQVENTEQKHKREMNERLAEVTAMGERVKQLEELISQLEQTESRTRQECEFWKDQAVCKSAEVEELNKQLQSRAWAEKQSSYFPPVPDSRQDSPTRHSLTAIPQLMPTVQDYGTPKTLDLGCGNCQANGDCACMEELAKLSQPNVYMASVPVGYIPPHSSSSPTKSMDIASSPAAINPLAYAEREIDFTAQFSGKRVRTTIAFMTEQGEADSNCGFCTDDSNCLCRDESLKALQEMQATGNDAGVLPPKLKSAPSTSSKRAADSATTTGPGTCADCMANPRQKAWCQRVAQLKELSKSDFPTPSPSSRHSSVSSTLEPMEPRSDYAPISDPSSLARPSVGCSEAYKLLEGRVSMDQDKMDWISNLKTVSPTMRKNTLPAMRKYSALELDTAGVIATLQQSMVPLLPRPSDGQHADLVRIAQEQQQSSKSPRTSDSSYNSPMPHVSDVVDITARNELR